jgi:hypothetical protein
VIDDSPTFAEELLKKPTVQPVIQPVIRPVVQPTDESKLVSQWAAQGVQHLGWLWNSNRPDTYDYGVRDKNFKWAMKDCEENSDIFDDIPMPWL